MGGAIDLAHPFQIPYTFVFEHDKTISTHLLPRQFIDGGIYIGKVKRCSIKYGKIENHGGYGNIRQITRRPSCPEELCVKSPHNPAYSLTSEAILQWRASEALRSIKIYGAIPHIYDIFQYAGETRFSMDFVKGSSLLDAIHSSDDPDIFWLQALTQVTLILGYLEEEIYLDHRDLKINNLWIRHQPISYSVKVGGHEWTCAASFQVVLIDFGFACLGGKDGNAIISLSDGIVPTIDPCPKEGRDLFQLVVSVLSYPSLRRILSLGLIEKMESLLIYKGSSYVNLTNTSTEMRWIYLAVSDRSFRHPPLDPASFLSKLNDEWNIPGFTKI